MITMKVGEGSGYMMKKQDKEEAMDQNIAKAIVLLAKAIGLFAVVSAGVGLFAIVAFSEVGWFYPFMILSVLVAIVARMFDRST